MKTNPKDLHISESVPNKDGTVGERSWTFNDPGQVEKHTDQFKGKVSKGDWSAMRDAANEKKKQRDS